MHPIARIAGCFGCGVLALSILWFAGRGCTHSNFLNHDPERQAALDEYWRGHERRDAGDYLAAIPHYEVYRQMLRRRGEDDSEITGSIAICLWRGGRIEDAIPLFDESLGEDLRWNVAVEKAHCMAVLDPAAGLAWLHAQPLGIESHLLALATFHRMRGDHAAAIPALDALCGRLQADLRFDAADELVDLDSMVPPICRDDLVELVDPLTALAESRFRLGDLEGAEHCAWRGVAVGRWLLADRRYYSSAEIEAGSVECRVLLARIAMSRKAWLDARTQVEHARVLADAGNYSPHKTAVQDLAIELARQSAR